MSRDPARHTNTADLATNVNITLSAGPNPFNSNLSRVSVFSAQRGGKKGGSYSNPGGGNTVVFDPSVDFRPGEVVTVVVPSTFTSGVLEAVTKQAYQFTAETWGGGSFTGSANYTTGASAIGTAVGDVDNDGDLDLLVANEGANTVSVRLNNGTGSFSGTTNVSVGAGPRAVVLADIDRDGDLDLLTANQTATTVSVRTNAAGVFSGTTEVAIGGSPQDLVVADFDADGDLDLAVATNGAGGVALRLNNGSGAFSGTTAVATGSGPYSVAAGDVDNDGDLDLVATSINGSAVSIRLNDGSANFSGSGTVSTGATPAKVQLGDLDGDGDLDLVTANAFVNSVSVRLNNGSGTYGGGNDYTITTPQRLALGDLDGDGDLDLVTASFNDNNVVVLYNNGSAAFSGATTVGTDAGPAGVALADVSGDGALDLLTANYGAGTASVRLNNIPPPVISSFSPTSGPTGSTSVTITGLNFANVTGVKFNGVSATTWANPTNNTITATVPAGATTGQISVTTATGTGLSAANFAVTPGITAFSPGSGSAGGSVTLTGTTFVNVTGVAFNGTPAASYTVNSATSITVVVPVAATTGPISVTTSSGTGTSAASFQVVPAISSFIPTSGPAGTTTVTITGTNLLGATSVRFGGVAATRFIVNSATSITALVPPTAVTGTVAVQAGSNTGTSATAFTVLAGNGVTSFSPARHALAADSAANVALQFASALNAASVGNLAVFGSQRGGKRAGATSAASQTLTFDPTADFEAGEVVSVSIPATIASALGVGAVKQVYRFTTAVAGGTGTLTQVLAVSGTINPRAGTVGELSGDDRLDFVEASATNASVTVRRNTGGLTYAATTVAVSGVPTAVALADLDGNSDQDLLTISSAGNAFNRLFNNGTGTFSGLVTLTLSSPVALQTGDVDADGDLDVVVLAAAGTAQLYVNNGSGSFTAGAAVTVGTTPRALALADVDTDGDLDLLVSRDQTPAVGTVTVYANDGNAAFSSAGSVAVGVNPVDMALADTDADGDLDLLAANQTANTVSLRLNNSWGTFSGATDIGVGTGPTDVELADLDADGDLDLLASCGTGGVVSIRTNAAGTFSGSTNLAVANTSYGLSVADLDGDRDLDLLVGTTADTKLFTNGNRLPTIASFSPTSGIAGSTFVVTGTNLTTTRQVRFANGAVSTAISGASPTQVTITVPAGATAGPIQLTNYWGSVTSAGSYTVLFQPTAYSPTRHALTALRATNVALTFAEPLGTVTTGNARVFSGSSGGAKAGALTASGNVLTFDPTADFKPGEVVAVTLTANVRSAAGLAATAQVYQFTTAATGTGNFTAASIVSAGQTPRTPVAGDVDGDGDLDLAVVNPPASSVTIRLNSGTGSFPTASGVSLGGGVPQAVALADLNADGSLDLLIALQSGQVAVRLNNGAGSFGTQSTYAAATGSNALVVGDFDADGDLDVAVGNGSANSITVLLNSGSGTFPNVTYYNLGVTPNALAVGDVDADGDLDLAFSILNTTSVRLMRNSGATFGSATTITVGTNAAGLTLADVDADADLDLVVANTGSTSVSVCANDGTGTFGTAQNLTTGTSPRQVAAVDVDGDGDLDLLSSNSGSNTVSYFLNNGSGTFGSAITVVTGNNPNGLTLADVDGDQDLDLLVAAENDNAIDVHLNKFLAPTISSFSPSSGPVGTLVTINGTFFSNNTVVRFNGVTATYVRNSQNQLVATVPAGATLGRIQVTTDDGTVQSATDFAVTPAIASFTPTSGVGGVSVVLTGTTFVGVTGVTFNGTTATYVVNSATQITATLPNTATSGVIRVTTNAGWGESATAFTAIPNLVSLTPSTGYLGSTLVLSGSALTGTTVVRFTGGATATFTVNNGAQITATVPYDALSGPLMLTTPSGDYTFAALPYTVQVLTTTGVSPARHARNASPTTSVSATFAQNITTATRTNLKVHSLQRGGLRGGTYAGGGSPTVTFTPTLPFRAGEQVSVSATPGLRTSAGAAPRHVWQFHAATTSPGSGTYTPHLGVLSDDVFGATPLDVDGDGDLDVATVQPLGGFRVYRNDGPCTGYTLLNSYSPIGYVDIKGGDVDSDGDMDLVLAGLSRVTVWKNNGTGTFTPYWTGNSVGIDLFAVELGDLDGDGDLDWVQSARAGAGYGLNDGTGTYATLGAVPMNGLASKCTLGDVDNDGDLDVVTGTGGSPSQLRVYYNPGSGRFDNLTPLSITLPFTAQELGSSSGWVYAKAVTSANDADGDGDLDLWVLDNANGRLTIHKNAGTGTAFSDTLTSQIAPIGFSNFEGLSVVDADADGDLDAYVGTNSEIVLARNNGTGRFTVSSFGVPVSPSDVTAADMDTDGDIDLVIAYDYGNGQTVYRNITPPALPAFSPQGGPAGTAVTLTGSALLCASSVTFNGIAATFTVNNDGQITAIAPAGQTTGYITVVTPQGTVTTTDIYHGPFTLVSLDPTRNRRNAARPTAVSQTFSDAMASTTAGNVRVFGSQSGGRKLGTATATGNTVSLAPTRAFRPNEAVRVTVPSTVQSLYAVPAEPFVYQFTAAASGGVGTFFGGSNPTVSMNPQEVVAGDIDNDGDLDLLSANGSSNTISVCRNNGSGTFAAATNLATNANPYQMVLLDVDADGDLDYVSGHQGIEQLNIRVNNGSGTFSGTGSVGLSSIPQALAVGDVDADGDLDLLVAVSGSGVDVCTNNGSGTYTKAATVGAGNTQHVALGDVDGDGDLDLLAASYSGNYVAIRLNNGSGTFSGSTNLSLTGPWRIALADIDGDDDLDLLAANSLSSVVYVRFNNGSGAFSGSTSVSVGSAPYALATGDVDGDGDLDLLTSGAGANAVSVRLNNGSGAFSGSTEASVNTGPQGLVVADLDGDDDVDIATANGFVAGNTLSVRFNQNDVPAIASFTPTSGPVGTSVVITGDSYIGVSSVKFNGVTATYTVNSTTQITATVPATATTGPISVMATVGTGTSATNFLVTPTITAFSPGSGPTNTSVTITGTTLSGATQVTFNGVAATITSNTATQIVAVVPATATTGPIAVTTPSGSFTTAGNFVVTPTILLFSPTSGPVNTTVTLTGSGFNGATVVAFNNVAASFMVSSSTQIIATVPTTATTGMIRVTTPAGTYTTSSNFTVTPTITAFSPTSGPTGISVVLTGTTLTGATGVTFNGVTAAYTVNSATQITATVPAAATSGPIAVTTPSGTFTTASSFIVTPVLTVFSPTSGPVGTTVTLTGTGFAGATDVRFNGTAASTFTIVSPTQITAVVPAGATTGQITVVTSGGGSVNSTSNFTVTPTITVFSPSSGPTGTSVVITGTTLTGATSVTFNGAAAAYTVNSATQITATVPAGATTGPIAVTTPGGTFTTSGNFTVTPTISAFSPSSGPTGISVVLTGTTLTGATGVTFNGVTAAYTVNSASQITATVPAAAASGPISVTTPGGTFTTAGSFVVMPTILSFSPTSGPENTTVTLTGTGLSGTTGVSFNGTAASGFTIVSPTQLTVTVPVGATTGQITVATAGGGSAGSVANFTVTPTITAFSPTSGPTGTSVVLTGTTLLGATNVTFNGAAASFVVNSATQLTATVPTTATTGKISVTTSGGTFTTVANFTVTPTILAFSPTSGPANTPVVITGTAFTGTTGVYFNGAMAAFTLNSNTQLTATAPSTGSTGPITVSTTSGTVVSATNYTFTVPDNDLCTAANLPVLACGTSVMGTTSGSSSTDDPTADCSGVPITPAAGGVFYRLTGIDGQMTLSTCNALTNFDTELFVFSGTCGAYTCVAANDDNCSLGNYSELTFTATAGINYLVFVTGYGGSRGNFNLTATCVPAPAITAFSPTSGPTGTTVILTGTDLTGVSSVKFNNVAASYTVNSATQITATVPTAATTGPIQVTNPGGTYTTASNFTVTPIITALSPTSGPTGISVVLTGTTLTGATSVTFNGVTAAYTVNSATQITATVPAAATSGPISVTTPSGTFTTAGSFTVTPVLTVFSPTSGPVGTTVTLTGTGFMGTTAVTFNGMTASAFTIVSPTQLTAVVPAGATTGQITVATNGGGSVSSTLNFTVTPNITAFSPTSGPTGTSVVITGTTLTGATAVTFNGVSATGYTVSSATQITATVPTAATTGKISVTTPSGTFTTAGNFTVTPSIMAFSPTNGPVGTTVVLTGTALAGANSVTFGGVGAAFTLNSNTQITATVPAAATTGPVAVTTPSGMFATTTNFTVTPALLSFSPTSGPEGVTVILTGTTLTGATGVTFNGVTATFTVNSATQITATVPVGATTGPIQVTTGSGVATSATSFTVTPGVTALSPTSGPAGTIVTLTGTNFTGATGVTFNGVAAASFTVISATQLTTTVPAGTNTGIVRVTTLAGSGDSPIFTVFNPVTAVSPARHSLAATRATDVAITLTEPVTASSAATVRVWGSLRGGRRAGTTTIAGNDLTFNPAADFLPGEAVQITVPATVLGAGGAPARPIAYQFTAAAGMGTGLFGNASTLAVGGTDVTGTALADLDGDGDLDLAACSGTSNLLMIRFNDGTGAFGAATTFPATRAWAVTAGDIDNDGDNDLLTALNGGTVAVYTNNGTGTFTAQPAVSVQSSPRGVVLADVDGDGDLDLLTPNASGASVSVGLNNGSGTFTIANVSVGGNPVSVAAGDLDADGDFDLVVADYNNARAQVLLNTGTGTFALQTTTVTVGVNPNSIVLADLNADGHLDLLTANSSASTVSEALGTGTGTFQAATSISVAAGPRFVTTGDLDGDGDLDLLAGSFNTATVAIRLNNGSGTFSGTQNAAVGTQPYCVAVGDVDADGDLDLAVANRGSTTVSVLFNVPVPTITGFLGTMGPVGAAITITGTGFSGATQVQIGTGTVSSYTVVNSTTITAIVPTTATTGTVKVTTAGGTATSAASFTVLQVFSGTVNQCLTTGTIISAGLGQWQYLLAPNGQLVAALNDGGQVLGQVYAEFTLASLATVRADVYGHEYVDRNWHLVAQNGFAGQSVQVRFYGLNTEFTRFAAANDGDANDVTMLTQLRLTQYDGPNENCLLADNRYGPNSGSSTRLLTPTQAAAQTGTTWFMVQATIPDHFSEFYLSGGSGPLPVQLVSVAAVRQSSGVRVKWQTAQEVANKGFIVQRSLNGQHFEDISALLPGLGTSYEPHAYQFLDPTAPPQQLYYRLLQLDENGQSSYSAIVVVNASLLTPRSSILLHPNPAHGMVHVAADGAAVVLLDATGRQMRAIAAGSTVLDLSDLPAGVYLVRTTDGRTARLVIE